MEKLKRILVVSIVKNELAQPRPHIYSVYDALVLFKVYPIVIETINGWLNAVLKVLKELNI